MHEIVPGVFLGSLSDARNTEKLTTNGIASVLSIGIEFGLELPSHFSHYVCHVADSEGEDIIVHFNKCIGYIQNHRPVLCHCFAGQSRSPTIVMAYLIKNHNMSFEESVRTVKSIRKSVQPNGAFRQQLEVFETIVRQGREVEDPADDGGLLYVELLAHRQAQEVSQFSAMVDDLRHQVDTILEHFTRNPEEPTTSSGAVCPSSLLSWSVSPSALGGLCVMGAPLKPAIQNSPGPSTGTPPTPLSHRSHDGDGDPAAGRHRTTIVPKLPTRGCVSTSKVPGPFSPRVEEETSTSEGKGSGAEQDAADQNQRVRKALNRLWKPLVTLEDQLDLWFGSETIQAQRHALLHDVQELISTVRHLAASLPSTKPKDIMNRADVVLTLPPPRRRRGQGLALTI